MADLEDSFWKQYLVACLIVIAGNYFIIARFTQKLDLELFFLTIPIGCGMLLFFAFIMGVFLE